MNMTAKPQPEQSMQEEQIRAALDQHWAASDANDFETEHLIYHEDAVLEDPQSGERTRGRSNIQNQRASQPSKKRFAVRRIIGGGDLWITEFRGRQSCAGNTVLCGSLRRSRMRALNRSDGWTHNLSP